MAAQLPKRWIRKLGDMINIHKPIHGGWRWAIDPDSRWYKTPYFCSLGLCINRDSLFLTSRSTNCIPAIVDRFTAHLDGRFVTKRLGRFGVLDEKWQMANEILKQMMCEDTI